MKQQALPTFYTQHPETKRKIVDMQPFLNYIDAIKNPEFVNKNLKNIEQHLAVLSKTPNAEESVLHVATFLCKEFKTRQSNLILEMIRSLINVDLKFEAKSTTTSEQMKQENINLIDNNQVIALPYGPVIPFAPPIAMHSPDAMMSDVYDQKKHNDSKTYYNQDNLRVVDYLQDKFKVVKRDSISLLFSKTVEIICNELFQEFLQNEFQKLSPSIILQLLKLLEYMTPPLYTFYLTHLTEILKTKICLILELKETEKRITKDEIEGIISTLKNIADRWAQNEQAMVQEMQWALQMRAINLFISSQISQKKLFAVKLLCQVCRRTVFSFSKVKQQVVDQFIIQKGLLLQIYRADNHPQIITKGEQVFLYLVKQDQLNDRYIEIIFNLLEKCHEHVSKSLFVTLQRTGFKNIENNRRKLLKKIEELPRPSCFNEQTFTLVESIMVSTPPQEVEASLEILYRIMEKNYDRLKQNLKSKAVIIYFQVFIMGIEQNIFDHENAMLTLKPILHNPNSSLFSFMIQNFIFRLKDQFSKHNGLKCKKTLNTAIHKLMVQQKIHKLSIQDQDKHLKILQLLLQNYQELDQNLLSSEDLWSLIKMDRKFSKFLKYYPQNVQISLISHLITSEGKSSYDIQCIIDLYQLMGSEVKNVLSPLIIQDFFNTHNLMSKYLLAPHILQIQTIPIEQAMQKLQDSQHNIYQALSWVVLIRQILNKVDQKGFGQFPPYQFIKNGYEIIVKATNNINLFMPIESEIKVKSFLNVYQITKLAVKDETVDFNRIKIRLNNEYVSLNQLKQKICTLTSHRYIVLQIYQTEDCQWFNKDLLFNKEGGFKDYIIDIFKEVFRNYSEKNGRLRASQIAKIFQKATDTEQINQNDHRIIYIFNNYSSNGQFLKQDEWINFYYQSSLKNAPLVVDNLKKLGYAHLLKSQSSFNLLFSNENIQREFLSNDGKIYDLLFKTYEQLMSISNGQLQQNITRQFTSTLNLLPASIHILNHLKSNSPDLFFYSKQNNLYYWYISNLLESIYFNHISIEQYVEWKECFQKQNYYRFIAIYQQYLMKIIKNGPEKYRINIHLEFFIVENLGKVLRSKIKDIPFLNNPNIQITPLVLKEQKLVRVESDILGYIRQLGEICIAICKSKRDNHIAENILALVLDRSRCSYQKCNLQVVQQLIFNQIPTVRQIFNIFYYQLSNIYPQIKKQYYSIQITKNSKLSFKYCREYFLVLNKLLFSQEDDHYYKQISLLYQKEITEESHINNLSQDVQTDQILLGQLKILNDIKLYNPQTQIINSTVASIKNLLEHSLSEQVRDILYSMSSNICDVDYSLRLMIKIMKKTNLKRNSVHRGKKKMGIMNLGCICYINSVLQQLEMIEPFRRGIIATQVLKEDADFFTEFQHIIYQLTYGQRIFLIPEKFCLSYLDHNNMPINIKQQHDADEFLNQLFDRLQFRLKNTSQRELINSSFKGQLVNIINCQKCYHKKQKLQNFYILSVQIKNQSNLKECLNKLIEPEIICDYFCDFCQGKVETIQKYNRFHSLPPFLFIHLQRLVFDLQTFTKIKLTHPIQFPVEINLAQFFNQETTPQIYILKGFVVHVGNSQGGHYYSIIKCGNGWIKFDDTRIDDWDWNTQGQDRNNAYLLIYEKKQLKQIVSQQVKIGNKAIMNSVQQDIDHLMKEKIFLQPSFTHYLLDTLKKIHVPEEFQSNPTQSPYQFNFYQMPQGLQNQLDLAFQALLMYIKLHSDMKQMRINTSFNNDMKNNDDIAIKENGDLQNIVYFLVYILHLRPKLAFQCVQWYLKDGSDNFIHAIYAHKDKVNRDSFKVILIKIVKIISAQIGTGFLIPLPHNEIINRLLQKIMMGLNEVGKNTLRMFEYFHLLYELCVMDNRFVEWFQANKLGPKLIHFYMQKESNLQGLLPNYPYYMSTDRKVQSISVILQILSLLVAYQPDLTVQKEETIIQRKAYLNIDFYRKLLNDRYDNQKITDIFNYAARNEKISQKFVTLVLQNLNRFSHEDKYIYIYIHIMYGLLNIKDGLSKKRLERLLGIPLLAAIGDNDADRYFVSKAGDRICKYWNPYFKPGDQIIFSFLELLYTNKNQHNYFTLLGIICLLKLTVTNQQVYTYVSELPRPAFQYNSYMDWINDFLFNFQKVSKTDNNIRMSSEQKLYLHQQIAKQMRELEIVQEKSNFIESAGKNKQYYDNGLIKNYSQWQEVNLQFFENLIINNNQNIQQINNISPNQIITIQYRVLYRCLPEQMQERPKIIQYRIETRQKAKIYFTQFYNYTFIFESGGYQFTLPFSEAALISLKVELLEEVTLNPLKPKKEQVMKDQSKQMNDEYLPSKNNEEFPSITQVYGAPMSDNVQHEMKNEGFQIQCPFCTFKASSFNSKCPNCNEQWGW